MHPYLINILLKLPEIYQYQNVDLNSNFCQSSEFNRKLLISIMIIWVVCRFMQRVAGVSWAKPDSDNAQFGKEILVACPNRGASCGRLCIRSLSLFQEMLAVVALHSGLGPVRLNFGSQKKLRTVTGAVICRKDLALIHDRDMLRHKARGERRA